MEIEVNHYIIHFFVFKKYYYNYTMNKHNIFSVLLFCFFVTSVVAQTAGEKKGWPSSERHSFITECIGTAKKNMSDDSARSYCYCMQEKMEAKYPDIADASKITAKDLASPEWVKEIKSCIGSTWSKKDHEEFVTSCINSAKASLGETKAKNYCECMVFKIEKIYPNATDADKITAEDFKTESWQKLIRGCLDF